MATAEALHFDRPVTGVCNGATAKLIRGGFNGLLYALGDTRDLACQLRRLVADRELAARMGENGRQWAAERFSMERLADDVQAVLAEALPLAGRG